MIGKYRNPTLGLASLFCSLLAVAQAPPQTNGPDDRQLYASTITEEELREHLFTYASDEFEGRETGKPGQKKAVAYIEAYYESLGIPAVKGNGDYLQKVPLKTNGVPQGNMKINGQTFEVGEDILTFSESMGKFEDIVYVAYGIEDDAYSDYKGVDVNGKVVLIKYGEPLNADSTYTISGTTKKSAWGNMSEAIGKKTTLAMEKGAKGILYYDPDNFNRYLRYYDYMKANNSGSITLDADEKEAFMVVMNTKSATTLFPAIATANRPKQVKGEVDLTVTGGGTAIQSENVAAILKGRTKPDEYLIISSHLDHIGINGAGQINNGADDDGSGTVALFEIAEAFKKAADEGRGPERSVIFLHVTGEEKGLLGSKFYTDHDPLVPLAHTVANLNIDMVGRIDPKREGNRNYIYLIGSDKLSTELHELSEAVNATYANLELDYKYNDENDPNRFYYRSDHYNFAKNNIPIIFYFNGTHADYHKPTDTPDKINYDLLMNRTQLIFHTAWEVANRKERVKVDKGAAAQQKKTR